MIDTLLRNETDRSYGIDALRIYAMFLIVVLHVLGPGGVLKTSNGWNYHIAWLMEVNACCAVNCYALISGYVGVETKNSQNRIRKYLSMWIQVFFYSFGITIVAFLINHEVIGIRALLESLFPVATNQYWYFSCYTALFFLIPWLNRFIQMCDNRELTRLVALLVVMFSTFSTLSQRLGGDPFVVSYGYSMVWLITLYLIGAWMKKCHVIERIPTSATVAGLFVSILVTWVAKQFLPNWIGTSVLVSYISPMNLLIAASYFCLFAKLRFPNSIQRFISVLSPAAFGVYLIHVQKVVWQHFIASSFSTLSEVSVIGMIIGVLGCAVVIFSVCICMELVRIWIFRLLHMEILTQKIGNELEKTVSNMTLRIEKLIDN